MKSHGNEVDPIVLVSAPGVNPIRPFTSHDWCTVLGLIAQAVPVLSIEDNGACCPIVHFDDSYERASILAEYYQGAPIVPTVQRLAKNSLALLEMIQEAAVQAEEQIQK